MNKLRLQMDEKLMSVANHIKNLCLCAVLCIPLLSHAEEDLSLEALEKQIQEQEQAIKAQQEAEEKQKAEAARKAKEKARRQAEEAARKKQEEEQAQQLEAEAARQAELEAARRAEEERRRAEAEAESRKQAEEERLKAEVERKLKEEAELLRQEAKQKRLAEETAVQKAKEALLAGEMVFVKGGTFTMGEALSYWENHEVTVPSFWIGKFEVTTDQWLQVMGNNPSRFKGCAGCPVENVSWEDVQQFLEVLNRKTGSNFRLPTEAEWEYACRSGGKPEKYCGGDNAGALGWFENNSRGRAKAVGQKGANGLGIHDMSGNVGEWVQDCWNDSYSGAPNDGGAWLSGNCLSRAYRGGSWGIEQRYLNSSERLHAHRVNRNPVIGFRLAKPE